jgi:hypothetical protein
MHPKTKKRWRQRVSWLAMVCFVVPLVKLMALFRVRHTLQQSFNTPEEWVANYLRLEYGEDATDPDSLQASDLSYLGRFEVNGCPTDYWQYPTSDKTPAYATMTMRDGTTELSMTDEPPTGERLS